jgi:prevent-host-death family protein
MSADDTCRVGLDDAEAKLPELTRRVEAGEEILICRTGADAARLISLPKKFTAQAHVNWEGKIWLEPSIEQEEGEMLFASI